MAGVACGPDEEYLVYDFDHVSEHVLLSDSIEAIKHAKAEAADHPGYRFGLYKAAVAFVVPPTDDPLNADFVAARVAFAEACREPGTDRKGDPGRAAFSAANNHLLNAAAKLLMSGVPTHHGDAARMVLALAGVFPPEPDNAPGEARA